MCLLAGGESEYGSIVTRPGERTQAQGRSQKRADETHITQKQYHKRNKHQAASPEIKISPQHASRSRNARLFLDDTASRLHSDNKLQLG